MFQIDLGRAYRLVVLFRVVTRQPRMSNLLAACTNGYEAFRTRKESDNFFDRFNPQLVQIFVKK